MLLIRLNDAGILLVVTMGIFWPLFGILTSFQVLELARDILNRLAYNRDTIESADKDFDNDTKYVLGVADFLIIIICYFFKQECLFHRIIFELS
jgi:hypothetical protein